MITLSLSFVFVLGSSPAGAAPEPAYSPPPPEASPFTSPDTFCDSAVNAFPAVAANDPRLKRKITVVMLTPSPAVGVPADAGPAFDPVDASRTFGRLINRCGGIGGRKIDFRVVVETGDPHADCVTATSVLHADLVVSWTASPAQSCVVDVARTPMVSGSPVSNMDLVGTQGRLLGTDSSEGLLQSEIVGLVDSGRFDGKRVSLLESSGSPADPGFARTVTAILDAHGIAMVARARADVLLTRQLQPQSLALPQSSDAPIEVYGFSDTPRVDIDSLRLNPTVRLAALADSIGIYTWSPITNQQSLTGQADGHFTQMCTGAYDEAHRGEPPTTRRLTRSSTPRPPSETTVQIARVCLVMRIAARGLFNAGVAPSQVALIAALHRLPYVDDVLPDGTPKARPNQVFNEPVTRATQVVALSRAQYPCDRPSPDRPTLPASAVTDRVCWAPVAGWETGRAVNTALIPQ